MNQRSPFAAGLLLFLLLLHLRPFAHTAHTALAQPAATTPSKWEPDIQAFEKEDQLRPPTPGQVLFVGSSSIRGWKTLPRDFPDVPLLQRGFGGSKISDCIAFADRIVLPYKPRLVVFYAGDNDIAGGESPEEVFENFKRFTSLVQSRLPETRVAFIAIKPSLARWTLRDPMRKANELVKTLAQNNAKLDFIDIYRPMLGPDGKPRPELFVEDGLHLNPEGYRLWASIVKPYLH